MKAKRDVKIEHLREVLPFDGCTDEELRRIALMADEIAVPAGYVLVYEGDWGGEVFIVAEGRAEVTASGRALADLGPGAVVGELAVRGPIWRTASVTAGSPMRFFAFERDAFDELLESHPVVARRMMSGPTVNGMAEPEYAIAGRDEAVTR